MVYQPNFILGLSPSHNRMCLLLVCCPFSGPWILAKYCGFSFGLVCVCFSFWLLRSLDYLFPLFDASFPYEFHHISVFLKLFFSLLFRKFRLEYFLRLPRIFVDPSFDSNKLFWLSNICILWRMFVCGTCCCSMCFPFTQARYTHTHTHAHTHPEILETHTPKLAILPKCLLMP